MYSVFCICILSYAKALVGSFFCADPFSCWLPQSAARSNQSLKQRAQEDTLLTQDRYAGGQSRKHKQASKKD